MPFVPVLLMLAALTGSKIAVTSLEPKPGSAMADLFARAPWLMVYDPASKDWEAVDNSAAADSVGNAARLAVEELKKRGVKIVITGTCGTNASQALIAAGIKAFQARGCTVAEALRDYQAGRLKELN